MGAMETILGVMVIAGLMTSQEAGRLYKLSPSAGFWHYWGRECSGYPKLARRLVREVHQFRATEEYLPFLIRELGAGKVLLKIPALRVAAPGLVDIAEDEEGEVLVGVERGNLMTWGYALELYRLVRRLYRVKGGRGLPGDFSWKLVAAWLQEDPTQLRYFGRAYLERKLRRWEGEAGQLTRGERADIRRYALLEIRRGLKRAGLKLSYNYIRSGVDT